jgi:hypothetical protein
MYVIDAHIDEFKTLIDTFPISHKLDKNYTTYCRIFMSERDLAVTLNGWLLTPYCHGGARAFGDLMITNIPALRSLKCDCQLSGRIVVNAGFRRGTIAIDVIRY